MEMGRALNRRRFRRERSREDEGSESQGRGKRKRKEAAGSFIMPASGSRAGVVPGWRVVCTRSDFFFLKNTVNPQNPLPLFFFNRFMKVKSFHSANSCPINIVKLANFGGRAKWLGFESKLLYEFKYIDGYYYFVKE